MASLQFQADMRILQKNLNAQHWIHWHTDDTIIIVVEVKRSLES
jgi:hypothetical protein